MYRKSLIVISALALIAAVPNLAIAKSIKNLVTPASLSDYCAKVGVGTENEVTITLPDDTTVTGTIHCEDEDVVASGDDSQPSISGVGDDDGEDDGVSSSDDGADDGVSSPDDGEDDSAGPGDDDSNDDNGVDNSDGSDDSADGGDNGSDNGDSGDDSADD